MKYILFLLLLSSVCFGQNDIIWDSPIPVAGIEFGNLHPRIVLNRNEDPVILWGKSAESAAYISTWDGTGFTIPLRVNPMDIPLFTATWAGPDIAGSGDTIYVVFKENPEDSQPAYCVHSYDGGLTFSIPVVIDAMPGGMVSRFPSVAVSNSGEPSIVYMQFDAGFVNPRYVVTTSPDFGNSFTTAILASGYSGGVVCDCCPAGIAANNNFVASLYRDNLSNLRNSWSGISSNYGASFDDGADESGAFF